MGSYPDVVDISSEEEDVNNCLNINTSCMKTHSNGLSDPLEWLDDLIVMDDLSDPPAVVMPKKTVVLAGQYISDDDHNDGKNSSDDDDDDCQVLDSDPDKLVAAVNSDKAEVSDEIEIVGAKGEVACRDFPHPRHLCANFPFNSTSHDKYCQMCHCYVCDSPAPCTFWGNSVDFDSHCHATDKVPIWKKRRDSNKAPSLQKNNLQNVMSRVLPSWHPVHQKSHAPNTNPVSRPISIQIPSRRSTTIGPITTGSIHGHRSGPYPPVRPHQLSRSSSMHAYSSDMFRRTGQSCHPLLTAHQAQPGPNLNRSHSTSHESLRRSLNSVQNNNVLQRSHSQSGAPNQVVTSTSIPVLAQSQMGVQGILTDVSSKSWRDILASVASELGVDDYSVNTSVVQQPVGSALPVQSGALGSTHIANIPTQAQSIDSTIAQNVGNLDANDISGNSHAIAPDMFETVVSSPLFDFEENCIDSAEI
ncbi:sarcosine dehydrogenase-2C protein [Rhynchospora pubera]|uniref:Sarcosine dehydrogenase-2C protein n=1 Tax=Rhynchospora pubera TaxID=906938 RepID=A0AAV8EYP3_9POAL|nr:sarcosine dehydrogenase-2C protein [Rhynchospora pubera]